jgi:GAF domain-containing protein
MSVQEATSDVLCTDVVSAFGRIALSLEERGDMDALLHVIAQQMCELFAVRRCSVYLHDDATAGLFRGRVAHAGHDVDAAIRRLVAGTDADRFTGEILMRREPVLISDAQQDPRPVRGTMRAWGVRSMLGVPMLAGDEVVGLLYLDDDDATIAFTREQLSLAAMAADLAAATIVQAQRLERLRVRADAEARKTQLLQQTAKLESHLIAMLTSGTDGDSIATELAAAARRPVAVYGDDGRLQAAGAADVSDRDQIPQSLAHADVRAALDRLGSAAGIIGPFLDLGIRHRLHVNPVPGSGSAHVILVELHGRLGAADGLIGRCAADVISLEHHLAHRLGDADHVAGRTLARDLLLGRDDPSDLERRAGLHGLRIDRQPYVVCLFASRHRFEPMVLASDDVLKAFPMPYRRAGLLAAAVDGGVAVFVPVFGDDARIALDDAKRTAGAVAASLGPDGTVVAGLSRRCRRVEDFARARRECDQVIQCFAGFVDDFQVTVIAADDLGAARLILATGSPTVVTRFAADVLGPLARPSGAELLRTLATYLESGRLVRHAGQVLGIHENTVRYRLSKVAKLTGLDVLSSPDDELTAQIAVTVLRVQGRLPRPTQELAVA